MSTASDIDARKRSLEATDFVTSAGQPTGIIGATLA